MHFVYWLFSKLAQDKNKEMNIEVEFEMVFQLLKYAFIKEADDAFFYILFYENVNHLLLLLGATRVLNVYLNETFNGKKVSIIGLF